MLPKRDTRAQLVIVENGKYVMLEHHIKQKDLFAWGIPGGGVEPGESEEEAAVREAFEETGLEVRLLPNRFERYLSGNPVYRRAVTFIAIPVGGEASLGSEPEEDMKDYYALTGIKWHPLYDRDIPRLAFEDTEPVLDWLESDSVEKTGNHVVEDFEGRHVLVNGCGSPLLSDADLEREALAGRIKPIETLEGNFVVKGSRIIFETTTVHKGPREGLEDCGSFSWVEIEEVVKGLRNAGVGRRFSKS